MKDKLIFFSKLQFLKNLKSPLAKGRMVIFIDEGVIKFWEKKLEKNLFDKAYLIIKFKAKENNKVFQTAEKTWKTLLDHHVDRNDFALIIGGGITLDVGGFIFSLFKRGISYYYIPTTLLSLVDSTVGGKVAVNFMGKKNIIGTFNTPIASFICPDFLKTLPPRHLKSGLSELFKHFILNNQIHLLKKFSLDLDNPKYLMNILKKSLSFKLNIVQQDPREKSLRKMLNLGHSVAHALESLAHKRKHLLHHGEAVAIGIMAESFLSNRAGLLSDDHFLLLQKIFSENGLPSRPKFKFSLSELKFGLQDDKKNRQGENLLVLWTGKKVKINYLASEGDVEILFRYLTGA